MNGDIPIPPGAERPDIPRDAKRVEVQVVDSPEPTPEVEDEKVGFLRRAFRKGWAAVCAVGRGVSKVASYAWSGVTTAYAYTLDPVFNLIERWVPGAMHLRRALKWYLLALACISAFLIGLLSIEAGYGLITIPMMLVGAVLIPILVFSTPAAWPQIAVDLWILSVLFSLFGAIETALDKKGKFLSTFAYSLWPGVGDLVTTEQLPVFEAGHEVADARIPA